jgi:hypothetical protein
MMLTANISGSADEPKPRVIFCCLTFEEIVGSRAPARTPQSIGPHFGNKNLQFE